MSLDLYVDYYLFVDTKSFEKSVIIYNVPDGEEQAVHDYAKAQISTYEKTNPKNIKIMGWTETK